MDTAVSYLRMSCAAVLLMFTAPAAAMAADSLAAEKQRLHEMVFNGDDNMHGDQIPIVATERTLNRAWEEIRRLRDESLFGYEAAFYIFPQDGKPITLTGILMPAGDDLDDIHMAIMHMRANANTMERLAGLPASTIVYAVDETGNKAWYPLKFFTAGPYEGYLSSEGFYAYTYRPEPKYHGRYGKTSFYLNIMKPELIADAQAIPEGNLTFFAEGLPYDVERASWYSRYAFYAPVIPLLSRYPLLADINYELSVLPDEDGAGRIEVKVPFGFNYEMGEDSLRIYAARTFMEGLGKFRSSTVASLRYAGNEEWARRFEQMELAVTHFNDAGDASVIMREDGGGAATVLRIFDLNRNVVLERQGREKVAFARDGAGKFPDILERHIALSGNNRLYALETPPTPGDWRELYDTTKYGISSVAKPPKKKESRWDDVIGPDRYFELDVFPGFRGDRIETVYEWLEVELQRERLPAHSLPLSLDVDMVIDEKGELIHLDVPTMVMSDYARVVTRTIKKSTGWTPGVRNGVPVKVRYKLVLYFLVE